MDLFCSSTRAEGTVIEATVGGNPICYVQVKYDMDPTSSCKHFYVNADMQDSISEPLYHYVILSATFNSTLKHVFYTGSVVEHESGLRYVVLALLRTKCAAPRIDVVIQKLATGEVFLLGNIAEFRRDYKFLPEVKVTLDREYTALKSFFVSKNMFWNKLKCNKLINGDPDLNSWEPTITTVNNDESEEDEIDNSKNVSGSITTRRKRVPVVQPATFFSKSTPKKKPKAPPKRKVVLETIANKTKKAAINLSDSDSSEESPTNVIIKQKVVKMEDEDEEMQQIRQKWQEAKNRDREEEKARMVADMQLFEERAKYRTSNGGLNAVVPKKRDIEDATTTESKSVASTSSTDLDDGSNIILKPQTSGLSYMQMKAIQDQTKRAVLFSDMQMSLSLYENMLFGRTNK